MAVDPASFGVDHYDVLGVPADATAADITGAYRRLARERHPDVNAEDDAARRFSAVADAYAVLSDPARRAEYDRARRRTMSATRTGTGPRYRIPVDNRDHLDGRRFGRDGDHVVLTVPVSYSEAVLGADVIVPTPDGTHVTIRIPAGVRPGQVLRIPGHGVPGRGGDLLMTIEVTVPRGLAPAQRALIEQLREYDPPDLRSHLEARFP